MGMQSSFCSHSTCTLKIETRHLQGDVQTSSASNKCANSSVYIQHQSYTSHTSIPSQVHALQHKSRSKILLLQSTPTSNEQEKTRRSPENRDINGATPATWPEIEIEKPPKDLDSALPVDGGGGVPELLALSSRRRRRRGLTVRRNRINPC